MIITGGMPTATPVLSSAPVRPLTSREIAKILCSILSGVADPDRILVGSFSGVLDSAGPCRDSVGLHDLWAAAFLATVAGFYTWCRPIDVETALAWIRAHVGMFHDGAVDVPAS